jgi:hypothetical protein
VTVSITNGGANDSLSVSGATQSKAVWTPSGSNYDRAGNACATTYVNGGNKKQF